VKVQAWFQGGERSRIGPSVTFDFLARTFCTHI
jgi:hypothetical protein